MALDGPQRSNQQPSNVKLGTDRVRDVDAARAVAGRAEWHDDETDEFIPSMIKEYGLPDNGTVLTDFDLIEMDEGRWRPDQWRDGWE